MSRTLPQAQAVEEEEEGDQVLDFASNVSVVWRRSPSCWGRQHVGEDHVHDRGTVGGSRGRGTRAGMGSKCVSDLGPVPPSLLA